MKNNVLVAMDCMMSMMTSQALEDHPLDAFGEDPDVEKSDVPAIRAFNDQYKKSYGTPLC